CGGGVCTHPNKTAGEACGSPTSGECDAADTCNGSGVCQANNISGPRTPDSNDCTNDVCGGGVCTHPNKAAGEACGSPTSGECDAADTCNGSGLCQSNNISGPCTPYPTHRTTDLCGGGVCTHPNKTAGSACGSPTSGECDAADTCNGSGVCQ